MLEVESYPHFTKTFSRRSSVDLTTESFDNIDTDSCDSDVPSCELLDVDAILVASFRQLLKMYGLHVQDGHPDDPEFVFAGGLQQYLIKQAQKQKLHIEQPRKGAGTSITTTFHDFPVSKN